MGLGIAPISASNRCVLTTGEYSREVWTRDRCALATGLYSRQVCTSDRCVLATVLIRPIYGTVQLIEDIK